MPHLQDAAIEAESSLERDFVYVALAFAQLKSISHQPFRLELDVGRYTPDFLVQFKDGSKVVVEVKPEIKLQGFADRLAQADAKLAAHSIALIVAHDTMLRRDGIAIRAQQIRRYAKGSYPESEQELVLNLLRSAAAGLPIKTFLALGVQKSTILHMVSRQRLQISSDLDIRDDAHVCLPITNNQEGSHAIRFASWLNA
ncbi:hypothetical protein C8239_14810 [Paracidovorax avenae]|nr:hypothetical protein C8239_14810 [Paracidovorax avenae]